MINNSLFVCAAFCILAVSCQRHYSASGASLGDSFAPFRSQHDADEPSSFNAFPFVELAALGKETDGRVTKGETLSSARKGDQRNLIGGSERLLSSFVADVLEGRSNPSPRQSSNQAFLAACEQIKQDHAATTGAAPTAVAAPRTGTKGPGLGCATAMGTVVPVTQCRPTT